MAAQPSHHPIFNEFREFRGHVPEGFDADFIGSLTNKKFLMAQVQSFGPIIRPGRPPFDENYFGWIDILESVVLAKDRYTMFELGAGYGRWAVCAAMAARQKGIEDVRLTLVEAEPCHVEWLHEHLANNSVETKNVEIVGAALGASDDEILFYVGTPDDAVVSKADYWYGQSVIKPHERLAHGIFALKPAFSLGTYHGRNVIELESGWKAIAVPQKALAPLLLKHETIDLMDLDVQGLEFNVLSTAASEINERVRRVHIGTHGRDIEDQLRALFSGLGWTCIRNYPCGSMTETPYGLVEFVDGIQAWINPGLN